MARRVRNGRGVIDPNEAWSREKLLGLLLAVALGVLVVLIGLGLAVTQLLRPAPAKALPSVTPTSVDGQVLAAGDARDAAANRPWSASAVPPAAGASTAPTTAADALLAVPKPTIRGGVGGIDTGFPRTPEGAVGQLASIDQTLLTGMRLDQTRAAYDTWAMPGGVGADRWIITRNVKAFTDTLASSGGSGVVVTAEPVAGQIRATDGPDWVLACVLLDVRAHGRNNSQLGYGHCERMLWTGERWQIAPGAAPAQPGQVAIGSTQARADGWRVLTGFGAGS